jgi:hypothetical protein
MQGENADDRNTKQKNEDDDTCGQTPLGYGGTKRERYFVRYEGKHGSKQYEVITGREKESTEIEEHYKNTQRKKCMLTKSKSEITKEGSRAERVR